MSTQVAYTVSDFLKAFAIGRTKFYDEINSGRLKARKRGSRTIVLAVDAEAWLSTLPHISPKDMTEA